jgi:hypothetical protein
MSIHSITIGKQVLLRLIIQLERNAQSSVLFLPGWLCVMLVDIYANDLCSVASPARSDAKLR